MSCHVTMRCCEQSHRKFSQIKGRTTYFQFIEGKFCRICSRSYFFRYHTKYKTNGQGEKSRSIFMQQQQQRKMKTKGRKTHKKFRWQRFIFFYILKWNDWLVHSSFEQKTFPMDIWNSLPHLLTCTTLHWYTSTDQKIIYNQTMK